MRGPINAVYKRRAPFSLLSTQVFDRVRQCRSICSFGIRLLNFILLKSSAARAPIRILTLGSRFSRDNRIVLIRNFLTIFEADAFNETLLLKTLLVTSLLKNGTLFDQTLIKFDSEFLQKIRVLFNN